MSLADKLKNVLFPSSAGRKTVWKGPVEDGITQSLLGRFLVCRERFRILVMEGLKPKETFYPPIHFGQMWHTCEESLARKESWAQSLKDYCILLVRQFRSQQEQIDHWYNVCSALFPLYVDHWKKHPDVKTREPVLEEQVFDVPYKLPSGRTVRLRGKWDSVDLVKDRSNLGLWIQENKTKSTIDVSKVSRQVTYDLQSMFYRVALDLYDWTGSVRVEEAPASGFPVVGIRYNVVRRSAHKSVGSMLEKLEKDRADGRISEWFDRYNIRILKTDIAEFKKYTLDPILETLMCWWATMTGGETCGECSTHLHWRHPFGVYNVLDEGGSSDLDEYLRTGSEVGLERTDDLFPELH